MNRTTVLALVCSLTASWAGLAGAADIYTWKDDEGRVHMAGSVPERYKKVATKVKPEVAPVAPADRAAALARNAKERAQITALDAQRARADAARTSTSGTSAFTPQARARQGGAECDRLWREYFESQECFAPYQSRNRGTLPEAYARCKEVENPSYRCGPAPNMGGR